MKMRKVMTVLTAVLLTACLLSACANSGDNQQLPPPTSGPAAEINYGAYSALISIVVQQVSDGWTDSAPEDLGISYIFAYEQAVDTFGFAEQDINGDGINELLFGENITGESSPIYDMFTLNADGSLKHVFTGGERDRYYLCEDGTIAEEGSSGAEKSFNAYFTLNADGDLVLKDSVIYDSSVNESAPWYRSQTDLSAEKGVSITYDEAMDIMNDFEYVNINFTPFASLG